MNGSITFFDRASQVGSLILEAVGGGAKLKAKDVKRYLKLVSRIYNLLIKIHNEIIDITIEAGLAKNLETAKKILKQIDQGSLKSTFQAKNWCDTLEELGRALHPIDQDVSLSGDDQKVWDEFCSSLEQREDEVAWLYVNKLTDLNTLAYNATSLEELTKQVNTICEQLVVQKAQFDHLAKKARAMKKLSF